MKIYIDNDCKCHVTNDGTMTEIEAPEMFNGKCTAFIEGFRVRPVGVIWTRADGEVFGPIGEMIAPWKDYAELDNAQRWYEKALIADMQNALNKLGVTLDE